MGNLDGKVIIVTGAGSGIGRVSAETLAGAGASVVVADLDEAGAEATAKTIEADGRDGDGIRRRRDGGAQVAGMVEHAYLEHGRLDGAHNNAGILGATAVITETDDDDWRRVLDVNLTPCTSASSTRSRLSSPPGPRFDRQHRVVLRARRRPVRRRLRGQQARRRRPHKAAAVEYGRKGIRVNAVCPGTVRTPMMEERIAANPALEKSLSDVSPMRRLALAEEVANGRVAVFGRVVVRERRHAMPVDGGATIQ